ncbi:MAG TPA: hypothetical protein VGI46_08010 [Candidatus Acidoferrum sp.]
MKKTVLPGSQNSSPSTPPPTANELFSPRIARYLALALVVAVFTIYIPALHFNFILDDHRFTGDPRLQSPGHVWEYFTSFVWAQVPGGPLSFYRPVFLLWLRLNFILSGASPFAWHLFSIAKHIAVALLLGLLVWKLLRDRAAALLAAALFALHPAQTESVAWVTVPDPLMSAAVLGSLLFYLKYAESASGATQPLTSRANRKLRKQVFTKSNNDLSLLWLIASAAACLLALMAKETAIILPAVLFTVAFAMPSNKPATRETKNETKHRAEEKSLTQQETPSLGTRLLSAVRQTLPFLAVTVVYLLLRLNALNGQLATLTQHLPWKTVLLSWPATLWFYVKVLFWPIRSRAFADPALADTFSIRDVLLPALGVLCAAAILASACVWAWKTARRNLRDREATGVEVALLLGVLLLTLPILPALDLNALNPGDFLHGRYTYLPLAGLTLLLATFWHLAKSFRPALLATAGVTVVVFSVLTIKQEPIWKDDLAVFTEAHQLAPNNAPVAQSLVRAHVQQALALDEAGRCDEAMLIFEDAIRQYPQDWYAWAGQGECFFKLDQLTRAEQSLRRAAELSQLPRVTEEWRMVREKMGLPATPLE